MLRPVTLTLLTGQPGQKSRFLRLVFLQIFPGVQVSGKAGAGVYRRLQSKPPRLRDVAERLSGPRCRLKASGWGIRMALVPPPLFAGERAILGTESAPMFESARARVINAFNSSLRRKGRSPGRNRGDLPAAHASSNTSRRLSLMSDPASSRQFAPSLRATFRAETSAPNTQTSADASRAARITCRSMAVTRRRRWASFRYGARRDLACARGFTGMTDTISNSAATRLPRRRAGECTGPGLLYPPWSS